MEAAMFSRSTRFATLPFPLASGASLIPSRLSPEAAARLLFLLAGFVPIASLCAALIGLAPLHVTFPLLVMPATVGAVVVGRRVPVIGRLALRGLLAGMLATAIYDAARLAFVRADLWGDFIPAIGRLLLASPHASPLWGYGYRYLYDGGAMAVTFAMLPLRPTWRSGTLFGVVICLCLFATLLTSPTAAHLAFSLTPLTAVLALTGHFIYGSVLGSVLGRWNAGQALGQANASRRLWALPA
jgi:hypothetical protein